MHISVANVGMFRNVSTSLTFRYEHDMLTEIVKQ